MLFFVTLYNTSISDCRKLSSFGLYYTVDINAKIWNVFQQAKITNIPIWQQCIVNIIIIITSSALKTTCSVIYVLYF